MISYQSMLYKEFVAERDIRTIAYIQLPSVTIECNGRRRLSMYHGVGQVTAGIVDLAFGKSSK